MKIVFDLITDDDYNKRNLSKLLSSSFHTKITKNPSEQKLYNFFSSISPDTRERVKKLIFELQLIVQR